MSTGVTPKQDQISGPKQDQLTAKQDQISGLYAHFIGGHRLHPDGSPDLVRTNPAASDEVFGHQSRR